MISLRNTPKSDRVFGQDYIVHFRYGHDPNLFYLDCRNDSICEKYDIWTINRDSKGLLFYVDDMARQLDITEFLEFVRIRTPQYADVLLFMLPDPAAYYSQSND